MRWFYLFSLVGLFFFYGCGKSEKERFKIGVDSSWYPLDFGSQTAYVNGFVDDVLLEIASMEGVELEKVSANSDTLFEGLREKKYDAVLTALPRYPFYLAKYDFSSNFLDIGPVLIAPKNATYRNLNGIKGGSIGILLQDPVQNLLLSYPEFKIQSFMSIPDLLDALVQGELVAVLLDRIPAVQYVGDLYHSQLKIVSSLQKERGLHLVVQKGDHSKSFQEFNDRLIALKKKKKLKVLRQKWSLGLL
jgi:polar amino acid transport system substrate-binding protein